MVITSSAFADRKPIPARFTADGPDISPPLAWSDPPPGTQSFALIADDPDAPAGAWVHWVIYGLPARTLSLPENVPAVSEPLSGVRQGVNDFHRTGYGGPSPPRGEHHYVFTLYALDAALVLPAGIAKRDLLAAMRGHVLAECRLTGTYRR